MASGNAARIIRAPGRLVADPTSLATAYPHGGTELGLARLCVLQPLGSPFRVESEALADATDVLEGPLRFVFSCFLRGWDDDALRLIMPDFYSAGATSQHAVFEAPGSAKPGASAIGRARIFLFAADDPLNTPSVLILRGIAEWSAAAELAWQRNEELGLPIAIECLRNSAGRTVQIGRLADLTL